MNFGKRISALELALSAAVGTALAVYRVYWAGADGLIRALIGALGAALLVAFAVAAEGLRIKKEPVVSTPDNGYRILLAGSGFVLLLAAGLFWLEGNGVVSLLTLLKAAFPAACGVAALVRLQHGDRDRLSALLCLFPVFYLCFFLLLFYRANGKVPDMRIYGFETAAIIALLMGIYQDVSVRFEKPKPRRHTVFLCLGVAATAMELVILLLHKSMLLQINSFGWGLSAVMLGFSLQLCAGLFFPAPQVTREQQEPQAPEKENEQE